MMGVSGVLVDAVAAAATETLKAVRPRRKGYLSRRPGPQSPMWNACAALVREELRPIGSKARLARYLGIPRQRLQDFLKAKSRLPDAEIALQLIYWLAVKRNGRDLSI